MITIEQVKKSYNRQIVLDIHELNIQAGEIIGLVGNNGAGKTTLFSAILDLIRLDHGTITSKGTDVATSEHWKAYTGSYISENFLLDILTPDEYFSFIGDLHKIDKNELHTFLHQFEELFNHEVLGVKKYIRDLSKGNQKKTGIVASLIGDPEVIILDEPFANLDPTTQIRLKNTIRNIQNPEKVILISSHDLTHVTEVSDRIILLENGKLIKDLRKSAETLQELESYFQVK